MDRLEQLKGFLQSDPNDPFIQYAMAMEYVGRNNPEMAKRILVQLKENQPDYTALYYHLGKLLQAEGLRNEAISTYEEGIKLTKISKNQHQLAELQSALNNLMYDDE